MTTLGFLDRLWAKIPEGDGCWVWSGARTSSGYANVKTRVGHHDLAHRVAWEIASGVEVPKDRELCHRCADRACCRPEHLWLATAAEKMAAAMAKGAKPGAPRKTHCLRGHELTEANVRIIYRNGKPERQCIECSRIRGRVNDRKRYPKRRTDPRYRESVRVALAEYEVARSEHRNEVQAEMRQRAMWLPDGLDAAVLTRFWAYVDKTSSATGCWLWTGAKTNGYGTFKGPDGQQIKAHRLAYVLAKGGIPRGLFACHTCDNPPCVNPDHLYAGTHEDNSADIVARKRVPSNRKSHCPKGHEMTAENTYICPKGKWISRRCRICRKTEHDAQNAKAALRRKEAKSLQ